MAVKLSASMDLASLDSVKEWIGKTGAAGDDPSNTLLGNLIDRASLFIENQCNRSFALANYVRYQNGTGKQGLYYAVAPVIKAQGSAELALWNSTTAAWDVQSQTSLGFRVAEEESGLLWLDNGVWTRGERNWKLTIQAGFNTVSPDALPDDIQQACCIAVEILVRYRDLGSLVLSSMTATDGGSHTYRSLDEQQKSWFLRQTLDFYRLGTFGAA
jgi:hypothetical protein